MSKIWTVLTTAASAIWEFFTVVVLKLIEKINIFVILLGLMVFGYMNKSDVFAWLKALTQMTANILP